MPDDAPQNADWPDRFVYVCIATRANIVNLAPLAHAGKGHVVGLVILRGLKDPLNPSPEEGPEVVIPAQQLSDYGQKALDLPVEAIVIVDGDPDLVAPWVNAIDVAREFAQKRNAVVLFNVAGGRVPVKVGALVGIGPWPSDAPVHIVTVGQRPFCARLVALTETGIEDRLLPVTDRISLADYLAFNGLVELGADDRRTTEDWYSRHSSALKRMGSATHSPEGKDKIGLLNRLAQKHKDDSRQQFIPYDQTLDTGQADSLRGFIAGLNNDVELEGPTLRVLTRHGHKFITGHWLEGLLRKTVITAIGPRNDVEIVTGLRLGMDRQRAENDAKGELTDLDLVIYGNDGIDIVEAKAITEAKDVHTMIAKLQAWRAKLGGPNAKGYLVAPLLSRHKLEQADTFKHANLQGIVVLCGPYAVREAVRALTARFK